MRRFNKRVWGARRQQRLWSVPAVVIALMCVSALLTPLAGRSSSADSMSGMPTMGPSGTLATCFLPTAAFCDSFTEGPYSGTAANRGGDLDPTRWTVSRETEEVNPPQGMYNAFFPVTAQFCQTKLPGVVPDRDSFFCNGTNGVTTQFQGTEDMHWMTAMNDGGNYASIGARALQPFDFAGRTGTVSFMVDAVTQGGHSTWPSLILSDEPVQMPHKLNPGVDSPPRNGFQVDFSAGCGPTTIGPMGGAIANFPQTTVGDMILFSNGQQREWNAQAMGNLPCVNTLADHPNLIQVKVSQTSFDVWMAPYMENMQPGMPMTPPALTHVLHLDQSNGFSLNMTRGYVSFMQSQYAACKFDASCQQTYHWHAIGFDGPVLPADRDFEVPDALTPRSDGTVNLGYYVSGTNVYICCAGGGQQAAPSSFALKGVDLSGATSAVVTFNWRGDPIANPGLQVRLNGNPWRAAVTATAVSGTTNALATIPLSDLVSGTNTLQFNAPSPGIVSNIDLALDPVAGSATTTTTASSTTSSMLMSSTTASSNSSALSSITSTTSMAMSSTSMATSTLASQTHPASTTSTQTHSATTTAASSTATMTSSTSSTTSTSKTTSSTASTHSTSTTSASTSSTTATRSTSSTSTSSSTATSSSTTSTVSTPTFATSAKLSHYMQHGGQHIHITATVQDLTGTLTNGKVEVEVTAPDGSRPFNQSVQVSSLRAGQTGSYQFTWTTPSTTGTYTVSIAVYGPHGVLYSLNKNAATVKVI